MFEVVCAIPPPIAVAIHETEPDYEPSSSFGRYPEGRVHVKVGWQAGKMGSERPALCRVGNLSHESFAGESRPVVCLAVLRMVWAIDTTLRRRRENLGSRRQQISVRRSTRDASM